MLEFIEQHRNFIFTILPDFLRNKWTMMVLNIIIFVFFIKIANIFIEKFLVESAVLKTILNSKNN